MGQIQKRQKILDDQAQAQLIPAIAMVSVLHPIRLSIGQVPFHPYASPAPEFPPPPNASPAPEFPPPPYASPSPKIPPRTTHAVPYLEIPLPTTRASSHRSLHTPHIHFLTLLIFYLPRHPLISAMILVKPL